MLFAWLVNHVIFQVFHNCPLSENMFLLKPGADFSYNFTLESRFPLWLVRKGIREFRFTQILHCGVQVCRHTIFNAPKSARERGNLAGFAIKFVRKIRPWMSQKGILIILWQAPSEVDKREGCVNTQAHGDLMYTHRWQKNASQIIQCYSVKTLLYSFSQTY